MKMYRLFRFLKSLVWLPDEIIDNFVFRLHYKVTTLILVIFGLLVTIRQYFGVPIDCISKDDIPQQALNAYCWLHSTFSVKEAWFRKIGEEIPYPGIHKYESDETPVYHTYYQSVWFVLFLQALLFYIPRQFWKMMESGKIRSFILDLNVPSKNPEKRDASRKLLVECFMTCFNTPNSFSYYYLASECMNAINVICQMFLVDAFLGGNFLSLGSKVKSFTERNRPVQYDPILQIFPRLTKCTFHRFSSSGDVQRHDAMCVLPINIINEKIYMFLWFWFVILAIFSCLTMIYTVVLFISPQARFRALKATAIRLKDYQVEAVLSKCSIGDWFLLHLLSKNLHFLNFRDFMVDLGRQLEGKDCLAV